MDRSIYNQFPENMIPPAEILQRIESLGYEDSSWGNDEYPSYTDDENNQKIWIIPNYPDDDGDDDDDEKTAVSWTITIVRCDDDGCYQFLASYVVS